MKMVKYEAVIQVGGTRITLDLEAINKDAAIEGACKFAENAGGDFTDIVYCRLV